MSNNGVSLYFFPLLHFLLSLSLDASEVEAVLKQMIDRCESVDQGLKVSAEELASIFGLTDRETVVTLCSLFSKVLL